jgi:hypothetical protein
LIHDNTFSLLSDKQIVSRQTLHPLSTNWPYFGGLFWQIKINPLECREISLPYTTIPPPLFVGDTFTAMLKD